jgi:hypothetical protein
MCLITKQSEPEILEEDLIVYKLLYKYGGKYHSPFTIFMYNLHELYQTKIQTSDDFSFFDNIDRETFENENTKDSGRSIRYKVLNNGYSVFGQGFHSALTMERLQTHHINDEIYICIIPKGSEIYTNSSGLVISNQIIIKEEFKS